MGAVLLFIMLILFTALMVALMKLSKASVEYAILESQLKRAIYDNAEYERSLAQYKTYMRRYELSSTILQDKLISELIIFCHPDKHGGSEKASRLTQKLLSIRDGKK